MAAGLTDRAPSASAAEDDSVLRRFNETVEVNRTFWSCYNVTLAHGQNWTQPYTFRTNATGLWKVPFLRFKDGDVSSPYRELHLYVRVT